MQTQAPNRAHVMVAALFALSCVVLTIFVWLSFGGSVPFAPQGYELRILFPNASNLYPGADVRIAGVNVGKVVSIKPRELSTEATIELQRRYAPLPSDALAMIRNKTLLGETYVELSPGTANARKLPDDALLSSQNVQQIQTIDEVLDAFNAPTRAKLQQFLVELSAGLKGQGESINDALGNLAPTAQEISQVSNILDQQRAGLSVLLHDGSAVIQQVGDRQANLQQIVTAGNEVLATTAARNQALTGTVDALPPFLSDLRATMASADSAALQGGPTLKALLPAAPLIAPALDALNRTAPQLRSTLERLAPVLSQLKPSLPALDRVLTEVKPFSKAVTAAGAQLDPMLSVISLYRNELVSAFSNIGDAFEGSYPSASGPALHYVRGIDVIMNEDAFGWSYRPGSNRYNPYVAPGGVSNLSSVLHAFDCYNTKNPTPIPVLGTGSAPPCVLQGPWRFQGLTQDYPHVQANR
jgi:phospholipid/cholesterol/gamma-HCH transport system substrate-binding protein